MPFDATSEQPISEEEWRQVQAVVRRAIERATTSAGSVRAIPNISVWRGEMGANMYHVQRWNDEKLDRRTPRRGASAHLTLRIVYNYTGRYVGGLTPHSRDDVSRKQGPRHAEVRQMLNEIEAWTAKQPTGR